nr:unnamed protein product [Digitaria exilis]
MAQPPSVRRSNPQIYYPTLHCIPNRSIHPPLKHKSTRKGDCWHLKQERWKTTPSVESWSIGYTVLVHTLHFCCVPLNILPRSSCSLFLHARKGVVTRPAKRARSESPRAIRPWTARAGERKENEHLSPRSPTPHFCRGGKEMPATNKRRERKGWMMMEAQHRRSSEHSLLRSIRHCKRGQQLDGTHMSAKEVSQSRWGTDEKYGRSEQGSHGWQGGTGCGPGRQALCGRDIIAESRRSFSRLPRRTILLFLRDWQFGWGHCTACRALRLLIAGVGEWGRPDAVHHGFTAAAAPGA